MRWGRSERPDPMSSSYDANAAAATAALTTTTSSSLSSSATANNAATKRSVQLAVPMVIGNSAQRLALDAVECAMDHTHRWRVYVRGNALGLYIRKVVFRLHDSFANPVRTVDRVPFEVEETGWGEFEVGITIHLADGLQVDGRFTLRTTHNLRLHGPGEGGGSGSGSSSDPEEFPATAADVGPPIVFETYDEMVVNEPPTVFYEQAIAARAYPLKCPIWNPTRAAAEAASLEAARAQAAQQTAVQRAVVQAKYDEVVRLRTACGMGPPSEALGVGLVPSAVDSAPAATTVAVMVPLPPSQLMPTTTASLSTRVPNGRGGSGR